MQSFSSDDDQHYYWMNRAIALAQQVGEAGDVPVGAIMIDDQGNCLAASGNQKERRQDPTAHAEILVIREACATLNDWHLNRCTLYVTLEPCPMCAGAILQARVGNLVYGASDPKTGAVRTVLNLPDHAVSFHRLNVTSGICEEACRHQLQSWFQKRRQSH